MPRRAARKTRPRRLRRKSNKLSYADQHNFKFAGIPTLIQSGPSQLAVGTGSIYINSTLVPGGKQLNNVTGAFQFTLNQVNPPNLSMINTNFDRYRVNKITVRVIPEYNTADAAGAGTVPTMKVVKDYDDFKAPTLADVWSRRGTLHRLDRPFTISLVPKLPIAVGTSVTGGYAVMPTTWINMAYVNVPLYGIKFGIKDFYNTSAGTNNNIIRFEIVYHLSVREQLAVQSVSEEFQTLTLGEDGLVRDLSGNVVADHSELEEGQVAPPPPL